MALKKLSRGRRSYDDDAQSLGLGGWWLGIVVVVVVVVVVVGVVCVVGVYVCVYISKNIYVICVCVWFYVF